MIVVDAHLDLAFNHFCFGRDPRDSAHATREREAEKADEPWRGRCMVGLPEMRKGRVAIVFPTIFLAPESANLTAGDTASVTYANDREAEALGRLQMDFYRKLAEDERSGFRFVLSGTDLQAVTAAWQDGASTDGEGSGAGGDDPAGPQATVGMVPLMEGADPIRDPDDVAEWFERGVRIVGLAWRRTRYSGGTGAPGPLTDAGRRLVPALAHAGMALDLSHAAEESFFEALDLSEGHVLASHSNPRALCPGDRQLSDAMIARLAGRRGVIGVVPFNRMLVEAWADRGRPAVPLARLADCVEHVASVAGTHEAVGIGSDFDGGFGAEAAPEGLDTIADLPRLGDVLSDRGFDDAQIHDVLGANWIRFLERALPAG